MRLHVLLVTHYFEPEQGAPQRRWAALIERFAEQGHRVTVLAPPPHYPAGRVPEEHRVSLRAGSVQRPHRGVTVRRVRHMPHYGDIATRTLDHLVAAASSINVASSRLVRGISGPTVVVATAPAIESLLAGQALARRFGVPFVAEMRDAWPDLVAYTGGMQAASSPAATVKGWAHRAVTASQTRASMVVTTTESFAEVLRARGVTRVHVLRNGTTHTTMSPIGSSRRPDGPLRVLYMGTVGRSQGLMVVLDAVAQLHAAGVDIEARIVGHGADVGRLMRHNRALGGPVEILRAVDPAEVRSHYEWADSTIVSLRDWEPFRWTVPSKLYELLATGRHITALVAGEAAGIVEETAAGTVVTPGDVDELVDVWRSLAKDRMRLRINEGGRAWAEKHADYDSLASAYIELLTRVVLPEPHGRSANHR